MIRASPLWATAEYSERVALKFLRVLLIIDLHAYELLLVLFSGRLPILHRFVGVVNDAAYFVEISVIAHT